MIYVYGSIGFLITIGVVAVFYVKWKYDKEQKNRKIKYQAGKA